MQRRRQRTDERRHLQRIVADDIRVYRLCVNTGNHRIKGFLFYFIANAVFNIGRDFFLQKWSRIILELRSMTKVLGATVRPSESVAVALLVSVKKRDFVKNSYQTPRDLAMYLRSLDENNLYGGKAIKIAGIVPAFIGEIVESKYC